MRMVCVALAAAAVGVSGAASAQESEKCFDKGTLTYVDCPKEAMAEPMAEPAPFSWSGPYAGLHVGYHDPSFDGQYDDGAGILDFDDIDAAGVMAGGQIGYLHQFDNNIVLGAEISGSYLGGSGSVSDDIANGNDSASAEMNWMAEARIRAGVALLAGETPILPYVTGGVALGGYEASVTEVTVAAADQVTTFDETAFGGVVGGGLEVMLSDNLSLGAEGLYYFFDESNSLAPVRGATAGDSFDLDGSWAVRAKLNYHF